jgi:hypothetical protein
MTTQHYIQSKLADRPEVSETFGDAIRQVWFDGNTWRISIDVIRLDDQTQAGGQLTTTQLPSARLVLSAGAGLALLDRLVELAKELEANGTLTRNPPARRPPSPTKKIPGRWGSPEAGASRELPRPAQNRYESRAPTVRGAFVEREPAARVRDPEGVGLDRLVGRVEHEDLREPRVARRLVAQRQVERRVGILRRARPRMTGHDARARRVVELAEVRLRLVVDLRARMIAPPRQRNSCSYAAVIENLGAWRRFAPLRSMKLAGLPQSVIAESQVRNSSNFASRNEALPTRRSDGVMSQLSSASMPLIVARAALLVTSCCWPLGRRSTAETCMSSYFM